MGVNNLDIDDAGLNLITQFEGFRANPYQDQNNIWTIGYGSTYLTDGSRVTQYTPAVTQNQALDLLHYGCRTAINCINTHVNVDLNQNQFDALCDFVYNVGSGNFISSTLLVLLNQGQYDSVPTQLMRWTKTGGQPNSGLIRRRQAEINLWGS